MHQLITYACFYTPTIYMHNIQLADLAHKTLLYNHLFLYTEYSSIGQLIYIHNTFAHQPIFIHTTFIYIRYILNIYSKYIRNVYILHIHLHTLTYWDHFS